MARRPPPPRAPARSKSRTPPLPEGTEERTAEEEARAARERANAPTVPPPGANSGPRRKVYAPARVDVVIADMSKDPRVEKPEKKERKEGT